MQPGAGRGTLERGRVEPLRTEPRALNAAAHVEAEDELGSPVTPVWESDALFEGPHEAPGSASAPEVDRELPSEVGENGENAEPGAPVLPGPAWEQVGLFDADEAVAHEPESERGAVDEDEDAELAEEDDRFVEQPGAGDDEDERGGAFALELDSAVGSAELELLAGIDAEAPRPSAPEEPRAEPEPALVVPKKRRAKAKPKAAAEPEAVETYELTPEVAARAPAPRDADAERWEKLVFDAGCLILEENRVAVSMLEKRFEIDFDRACEVLDRLQAIGLIGPYMGGRTRDILLSREEWLAHTPNAP